MARIVKKPSERKLEIIQTAERLFRINGYADTSVDAIIGEMGVAKGTFYYYFKSKEAVLEGIVEHTLDQIVEMAEQVASAPEIDALAKMQMLLSGSQISTDESAEVSEHLHLPGNRELHELTNIQTVLRLSPIFAKIVEQGNDEKLFAVKHPLETIQFLLTSSQFLLDGGLFDFTDAEIQTRRLIVQEQIEKALGATVGSFNFMNPEFHKGDQNV